MILLYIMDNSTLILIFVAMILIYMIFTYIFFESKREFILGFSKLVQGFAVGFLLLGYIDNKNKEKNEIIKQKKEEYIKYVSDTFDSIEQMFLNNPKELSNLWYEFYGFDNFPEPQSNNDNKNVNQNENQLKNIDNNAMTQFEYITLLKIIQKIYVVYIQNNDIFNDINFSDKLRHYIKRSKKFKKVFAVTKDMYSIDFYKKLVSTGLIDDADVNVENVDIPKLISSYKFNNNEKCKLI